MVIEIINGGGTTIIEINKELSKMTYWTAIYYYRTDKTTSRLQNGNTKVIANDVILTPSNENNLQKLYSTWQVRNTGWKY